jgi:hypothetical protein
MQWSKPIPLHVPNTHKDIAPAYIEVGSGSFQVRDCCLILRNNILLLGCSIVECIWKFIR